MLHHKNMFIERHFEIFSENCCSKCLWQQRIDCSVKNIKNPRSHLSIVRSQDGGVNNYVMHSNSVKLRTWLMDTADNRHTELLRMYPMKNVIAG